MISAGTGENHPILHDRGTGVWPYSRSSRARLGIEISFLDPTNLDGFESNDASIRIRPTQRVLPALDWLAEAYGVTRLDILRALIFKHVYGALALEALQQRVEANMRAVRPEPSLVPDDDDGVRFSRRRASGVDVQHVGKAAVDSIELELPGKLVEALKGVAEVHQMDVASYCRQLLVQELEGERIHTPWRDAVNRRLQGTA